jgi:ribosome biogenesis GTPase / thiamine phosphate phosphatase
LKERAQREDYLLIKTSLARLGYDEWFHASSLNYLQDGFSVARVVEVNKGNYRVSDGQNEMFAELSGKFLFGAENSIDYPTIGDFVVIQALDRFSLAIVHHILSRKSLLKRKESGKVIDFQLIAANIDFGLIVQAVDLTFNLNRLERYLVMVNESKIEPIVVLTKIDLLSDSELTEVEGRVKKLNSRYLLVSNISDQGVLNVKSTLEVGKTYCLLGPSGVGKTTLLNKLLGGNIFKVNEVREKDGKGRHTTVRRQLIGLDAGSIFIDTPGMRELGNFAVDNGIEMTFEDILPYGGKCRFNDCSHTHEDGCAVIAAVEQGTIDDERYQNFLKIKKETAHYEMSYADKRKKDKTFGKMVKNYKRQKSRHE